MASLWMDVDDSDDELESEVDGDGWGEVGDSGTGVSAYSESTGQYLQYAGQSLEVPCSPFLSCSLERCGD